MKYCRQCSTPWDGVTQPGVRETCVRCHADLHVCLNCRFYDEHKPQQCQVDVAETVRNKDRSNFCEEFQFADRPLPGERAPDETKKAKEQWNRLFGKK